MRFPRADWVPAYAGALLEELSHVMTRNGSARIRFSDGAVVQLQKNGLCIIYRRGRTLFPGIDTPIRPAHIDFEKIKEGLDALRGHDERGRTRKGGQEPKTKWPEGCFAFLVPDPVSEQATLSFNHDKALGMPACHCHAQRDLLVDLSINVMLHPPVRSNGRVEL